MYLVLSAALGVALFGAWALGYSPKALWLAAKAKFLEWRKN